MGESPWKFESSWPHQTVQLDWRRNRMTALLTVDPILLRLAAQALRVRRSRAVIWWQHFASRTQLQVQRFWTSVFAIVTGN